MLLPSNPGAHSSSSPRSLKASPVCAVRLADLGFEPMAKDVPLLEVTA